MLDQRHAALSGRLVMVGFGSIGQGALPLLLRHLAIDPGLSPSARSNYALRESALALRSRYSRGPTAVLTHGANPGLVSHFVKQALSDVARGSRVNGANPAGRADWARLAERLGVKVIH